MGYVPINGFEDLYEINPCGRIRSTGQRHTCKKGILSTWLDKDGYERCCLCKNGKQYQRSVHRLVAETFISNPEKKPQVNHINGIRNDNRKENLEWVTDYENKRHSVEALGHSKIGFHGKKIKCIETGEVFKSQGLAARAYNTTQSNISVAVSRGWKAAGVHWILA